VAQYTEPALMVPLMRHGDAASILSDLCSALLIQGRIADLVSFYHAVLSHEALSSTAISPGLALPHARITGSRRLSFALGRTAEPLAWFGGEPISLVFLFAVPEDDGGSYLGLIASLARLAQDPLRLMRLADAPEGQVMFEVLQEIPLPTTRAIDLHP
jgi:mannitol/fructose-specific phosphotransferase system IIA component (Ntr-type)